MPINSVMVHSICYAFRFVAMPPKTFLFHVFTSTNESNANHLKSIFNKINLSFRAKIKCHVFTCFDKFDKFQPNLVEQLFISFLQAG